ncbi:hypothetical protein J3R30DRAFT_146112 [Lentinula aciculospora]|uniref:SET domain-containing protein n=1 Tax=Lentinula aciculospora TaxID=153920 RepID=A0A9W9AUI2_9AGAR|nr:hypothetical protein J3R30DRAFT_146112 [Lentinula aciculospora]
MYSNYSDEVDDIRTNYAPLRLASSRSSSVLTPSSSLDFCEQAESIRRYQEAIDIIRLVHQEFHNEHSNLTQEEINALNISNNTKPQDSAWITSFRRVDDNSRIIQLEAMDVVVIEDLFEASEILNYYCCTPASQNMGEYESLGFIPHADAPGFDMDSFLSRDDPDENLTLFPWQSITDPDQDIIEVEVARSLHYNNGFTFEEIDNLKLLRLPLRGPNDNPESGLLWEYSQREYVEWESYRSTNLKLPRLPTNFSHNTLFRAINAGVYHFCANLNCITSHCATHYAGGVRKCTTQPFEPCKPKETQEGLFLKYASSEPCGEFCFLTHWSIEETIANKMWSVEDDQELRDLLAFEPDANPCDLAVMCRKRCYEVYLHRRNIYPDYEVLATRFNENLLKQRKTSQELTLPKDLLEFHENLFDEYGKPSLAHYIAPCTHQGSCGTDAPNCSCYIERHYCQRNCHCPDDCPYRFPGCSCKIRKGRTCSTVLCPCLKAGRECDPERCISCDARAHANGVTNCRNVRIQQEQHNLLQIEIKPSKYGYGAFACQSIKSNRFIGEYVGEIQGLDSSWRYQSIHGFRNLNYTYDFKTGILNSATIGNEMRYLNHDSTDFNCVALYNLVNNDLRIAIKSVKYIKKGDEVLLDYGERYWLEEVQND